MAILLTCECGARFEVEELLAGQEVSCPKCQHALPVPARAAPPRTNLLALASVVLCLLGAFTILGTLAAAVLGFIAVVQINRDREHLTGTGFALFGIIGGLGFTALTVFALSQGEFFGMDGWVRRQGLAGQVDTSGSLEMESSDRKLTLRRPSEKWGRVIRNATDEPAVGDLQVNLDLLLVNVSRNGWVDVAIDRDPNNAGIDLRTFRDRVVRTIGTVVDPLADDIAPAPGGPLQGRYFPPRILADRLLPDVDGYETLEVVCEAKRGGQSWWFLVRIYRKKDRPRDPIYTVRAYTPVRRAAMNEAELRKVVDSIRFTK